jgi:predicted dehydrogenase
MDAAKKLAEENDCLYFTDAERMLKEVRLDAVILCVPTFLHEKYVTLCAAHHVNVLCEKPVEMSVQATERMLRAVNEAGIIFMVGQVVRFWTGYSEIKEMADAGELGEVYMAYASRCSVLQSWGNTWLMDPEKGAGAIQDMHVHDIDYLRYLLGPIDYVFCLANKDFTGCYNHVMTSIAFENGQKAVAEAAFTMQEGYPFSMSLKVSATKATIEFYYRAGFSIGDRDSLDSEIRIYRPGKEPVRKKPDLYDGYTRQLEYYLDCLEKKIIPDKVPQSHNIDVIKAICAIKESANTASIIKL